jgi:cell wall-associated NlpC family hydrolase
MNDDQRHWAAKYIGRPWTQEYRCWDLVREVFAERYGVAMPIVNVGDEGNAANIRAASDVSGWMPAEGPAREGDIVTMEGLDGKHVGVMIAVGRKLLLLHNNGTMKHGRPTGFVVAQPLADAAADGYHKFSLWRRP